MTERFQAEWLAQHAGGRWDGAGAATDDVAIDTRTLPHGALYVALRGERLDGHAFVLQAQQAGASAAMVDERGHAAARAAAPALPLLVVADTLKAMQRLATAHRLRLNAKFVGVAGSNGKTTTKEMIASVLTQAGRTHRTTGNLNNHIGLPLSLLRMREADAFGVLETGMNHPGELAELAAILRPDIAVITTIQAEHLEGLGTVENVAKAEGEILGVLGAEQVAVLPADEPLIKTHAMSGTPGYPVRWFGVAPEANVRLADFELRDDGGTHARWLTPRGELRARLPHLGRHNALNAAAAIAIGLELGLTLDQIKAGLESTPLVDRRLRIHKTERFLVLDDCYNANPGSMGAALEVLRVFGKGKRSIALLGDMLELGDAAPHEHAALGALAAKNQIGAIGAFGPFAETLCAAARAHGQAVAFATTDMPALIAWTQQTVRDGDVILVKGSRGMKMERLVEALGVTPVTAHGGAH